MKIGILTHYKVNNQGAQLQLYALYNFLKEHGHDPYVATYKKNYDFDTRNWEKRNEISIHSIGYILKEFLIKKGIRLTWHNYRKYKTNGKFRKENFKYCHYALDHMDTAVIGSDEVLSLQCGPNIMMYGHAVNADHLVAYAPCISTTSTEVIANWHCTALVSSGLKMFDALSARDEFTASVMTELTGRTDIPLVCDPVLLYDFSKVHRPYKKIKKKYMIAYAYDRCFVAPEEIAAIKSYAKSKGLKVASVGTYHSWCDYNIVCDPLQWIEYFRDAEEVVTNTFHGTILSIITNTPMAVIAHNPKIKSIMNNLGLNERKITNLSELANVMGKPVDFDTMNDKWHDLQKRSGEYLVQALDGKGE